ncbi:hypothetical protein [Sulfurimonas sp.]|uniref:hypothetical protein n=1 Tax=Sulfurimonas sp. TaxID=2022749 RepID=UPI00261BFDE7|nr:hypothetical protein [Sulfurimonas sp.]
MNKNFLFSLFGKSPQTQEEHNLLIDKIYSLKKHTNLIIYDNVDIFLHKRRQTIPLMIYDEYRALFLFEIKEWSYEDLKNASLIKIQKAKQAQNTLSYTIMHEAVTNKLDEIIHNSDVPIHNYLLMTHLSSYEYQNLDDSLKKILLKEKIIFNDLDADAILNKLQKEPQNQNSYGSPQKIVGSLLTQYTLVDKDNELFLANTEQKAFIDAPLENFTNIQAAPKSGLSSTLLLKAIFEILKNPSLKITIIKPTKLAKDILHRQFLEIIEHAIIEFDILSVSILTPDEIDIKKNSALGNIIMCDDGMLMQEEFIAHLKSLQAKHKIVLTNDTADKVTFSFKESYLLKEKDILFYETNPHAKALQLIAQLLKQKDSKELLIVSNSDNRTKLVDDLKFFIEEEVKAFDSSVSLTFQELETLKLATYTDLNELIYNDAILLDIDEATNHELEYAINHAQESVHILYAEDSQNLQQLKEIYASK